MLDKYIGAISIAIALWLCILGGLGAVYVVGVKSEYFRVGPASNLFFVGFRVDSWFRWCEVIALASISQLLYMVASETVSPWIMNTVMDQKTTVIPIYSYFQVQMICNVYYMFAAVVQMVQVRCLCVVCVCMHVGRSLTFRIRATGAGGRRPS